MENDEMLILIKEHLRNLEEIQLTKAFIECPDRMLDKTIYLFNTVLDNVSDESLYEIGYNDAKDEYEGNGYNIGWEEALGKVVGFLDGKGIHVDGIKEL